MTRVSQRTAYPLPMRVVVTGGAGFIGSNLCRHLLSASATTSVVVLDDLATGNLANLDGLDVTFVEGTILDDATLDRACAGASAIVHLAALGSVPRSIAHPLATHHANSTGTVMVLEAARRHGNLHVVAASSSSVYGSNPTLPKHEGLATRPMSPYGSSKLATESAVIAWGSSYRLPVLAFRFFNVFGPHQPAGHAYAAVIPAFVDAALAGRPLPVHGDGSQSRDFTYVDTVCAVVVDAITRGITSDEPINLAHGTRISLLDVIDELEHIVGHPLERSHTASRTGDVQHSQADSTRLLSMFGNVEPTPFAHGLAATVQWMRGQVPAQA